MIRKNGDKTEFDKIGAINFGLKLVLAIIAALVIYFNTLAEIKTEQAVMDTRIDNLESAIQQIPQMKSKIDSIYWILNKE